MMKWIDQAFREASIARGEGGQVTLRTKWCLRVWWFFSAWPWQHIHTWWVHHRIRNLEVKILSKKAAEAVKGGKYQVTFKFDERSLADLDVLVSQDRLSPELRRAFRQIHEAAKAREAD